MHDRPSIRARRAAGESVSGVARDLGASRDAVRRATAPGARDRYWRPSPTEAAEPAVRDLLADYPHMAVTDIALLIDWHHSRQSLGVLIARLRPEYIDRPDRPARRITTSGPITTRGPITTGRLTSGHLTAGTLTVGRPDQ